MRDPLSLAEALRIIGRHPGGAGYLPEGLAPLCIRATGGGGSWPDVKWRDTHPPLEERIGTLLAIAHVSPDEFERQSERAGEDFADREHWARGPAAGGAGRTIGVATAGAVLASAASAAVPSAVGPTAPPRTQMAARSPAASSAAAMTCPSCGAGLSEAPYEGVRILVCAACGGRLVTGAQIGARVAQQVRPERLRLVLAAVVLIVALRMALGLTVRPDAIYTITPL